MKLINNLYLALWAILQWLIFGAAILPLLAMGTIIGGIGIVSALEQAGVWSIAWVFGYIVFVVTCWTYKDSGFFWATPFGKVGK